MAGSRWTADSHWTALACLDNMSLECHSPRSRTGMPVYCQPAVMNVHYNQVLSRYWLLCWLRPCLPISLVPVAANLPCLIMLPRTANDSCVTTGCVKKAAGISLRSENKSSLYWQIRQQM